MHLPGKITYKEIDEMITTVDKGGFQSGKKLALAFLDELIN